jgi:hypothetical protein
VAVHFADATEKQKHELTAKVHAEAEQREYDSQRRGGDTDLTEAVKG